MQIEDNNVVVGYDGSEGSTNAVEWAAITATRRDTGLTIISSSDAMGKVHAEQAIPAAEKHMDGSRITAFNTQESPSDALIKASEKAQLVVVGHRGAGALRLGHIGSVAFNVAHHAKCPVAVIHAGFRALPSADFPSLVAYDGSKYSIDALKKASQWASETNSPLRIVSAWERPPLTAWSTVSYDENDQLVTAASRRAKNNATEALKDAREKVSQWHPDLVIQEVLAEGRPSEVIVANSDDVSLIVMGARGRGDFASLLLGSVSREVIEHAECAVYIVRSEEV